jgi:hypothetical protein
MSTPTMSKERVAKEDGRYLIRYRFLEADEGDEAPSMDDSEDEVADHEPAPVGSDAL